MPRPQAVVVCRPGDTAAIAILRRRTLQWRPLPVKGLAGSAVAGYAVSVTVDAATIAEQPPGERDGAARRWQLLPRLERSAIVTRRADGAATVARGAPAGCFLYGPYWHLQTGTYRLHVAARATAPHHAAQPALGIEILVLSRFQLAWRDFTAAELAAGSGSVTFTVPPELSADGGNEGRFEFRFFHLGNAALCVSAAELERLPDDTAEPPDPRHWRLLGRLSPGRGGRRRRDGSLAAFGGGGCLAYGGWPYLRLGRGPYRLSLRLAAGAARDPAQPVIAVEVRGRSRWRSDRLWRRLARLPNDGGTLAAWRDFTAAELAGGEAAAAFTVPTELGLEAGADAPFEVRLHHFGNAALTVEAVELRALAAHEAGAEEPLVWRLPRKTRLRLPPGRYRLAEDGGATAEFAVTSEDGDGVRVLGPNRPGATAVLRREVAAPARRSHGRKRLVFIGNCQCSILNQAFNQIETLSRDFESVYHFVQLQPNLFEFAQRDIERCDILLIQDIDLWNYFPLQHCIRPGTTQIRFPLVRFASLWPFDGWNGPGDRAAYDLEGPNTAFPYRDGLLGRLRREIPDPEARFRAYRELSVEGIVNYRRLHGLEERRLLKMDRTYECGIGAFILDNFRSRPIFHTTVRPNWQGFNLLLRTILKAVGAPVFDPLSAAADQMLRVPQVPVHPKVAADLGVRWADEKTRYLAFGREMTWEDYTRRYIEHYG